MRFLFIFAAFFALRIGSAQDPSLAKISGFSDTIRENNGKIDKLDIAIKVEVKTVGVYRVTFELNSANGNSITGRARGRLGAGAQLLRASFDARQIDDYLAQDGPYRISDARLFLENANAEPSFADSMPDAGQTAAYRLADLYRNLYSFTGEVSAAGANRMPTGKFETLRVTAAVVTPGGDCSWQGFIADENGHVIESDFDLKGKLPAGKGELTLDFDGYKVARAGAGQFFLTWVLLRCGPGLIDSSRYPLGFFRGADFDPGGDFEFVLPAAPKGIAAGDTAFPGVDLHCKCDIQEITTRAESDNGKLQFEMLGGTCTSAPACWEGRWFSLAVKTAPDLAPGTYPIRLTASRLGEVRTATVNVIVDAVLTQRKRIRAVELVRLQTEDAVPPTAPSEPPPAVGTFPTPVATFTAGVALRKIHAVLVLDRSASMNNTASCEFMTAAATRFVRLFVEDRDSVAVLSYGNTVQRTLPMTDHFLLEGPGRISKITCHDTTNTGEALEIAREELMLHKDPEAIEAVILFTDGQSNVLAANWPVKARGCTGGVGACTEPATVCKEGQSGQVPAFLIPMGGRPVFEPIDTLEADERSWYGKQSGKSCFGTGALPNFAYMPEEDLHGVALTGSHPLDRIAQGPYAGRIRLDSQKNLENAVSNQIENATRQLRSAEPNPAYLYIVGFAPPSGALGFPALDYLRQLTNDPQGSTYNPKEPAGLTVVTDAPEGFYPSFQRVRENIVEHATVK